MDDEKEGDYVFMVFVTITVLTATTLLWIGWRMTKFTYKWCYGVWHYEATKKQEKAEEQIENLKETLADRDQKLRDLEKEYEKVWYEDYEKDVYKEKCDKNIQELMKVLENQATIEKDNANYHKVKFEEEMDKTHQMEQRISVLQQRIHVLVTEKQNVEARMQELSVGRHDVLVTRFGAVWHKEEDCHHLRMSNGVTRFAPCSSCVKRD